MKNGKLNGKVAVVTGASKGIGAVQLHAPARGRPKMFTVVFNGSGVPRKKFTRTGTPTSTRRQVNNPLIS
jgi:NAD(P)-dependent dehydrogenase (short-subunit alcohol dehydrogenase family)